MKTIILALAATSALGLAAPAAAQSGYANVSTDVGQIQAQLQAGVRSGAISRAEAMPLRQQLRELTRLERHYAAGGFTRAERSDLRRRAQMLRQDIRAAAQDRYGRDDRRDRDDDRWDRDDRDGRWDRDCPPGLEKKNNGCLPPGQVDRDRDGRWDDRDDRGGWIDRNRDGYDDRDLNRDRRIDERERRMADERGYDDRDDDRDYDRDDDRYEERRGGLGGLIDDIVGGGRELRVGQRATADLRVLSSDQRRYYRDGDGRYYRTDGQRIYEIDARTQTVVRVHPSR